MPDAFRHPDEALDKNELAQLLRENLDRAKRFRVAANTDPKTAGDRIRLREWQAARLARTHRDLLESERYGHAAEFFLSDLYGPKDFSRRDEELERIVPTLVAFLPAAGVRTAGLAVEVDALSEQLDAAMATELQRVGRIGSIDEATYAAAYSACGDQPARERQIDLIRETGEALDRLAQRPLIAFGLHLMRMPAHLAGLGELHDFLERGFNAFRGMSGAEEFLDIITRREQQISRRLFAGAADPFAIRD